MQYHDFLASPPTWFIIQYNPFWRAEVDNKFLWNAIRKFLALKTIARNVQYFFYRAVHEIMRKNIVELDRPQMTIWRMCITRWITKAKTHTLRICSIYRFPTAKMGSWTRLSVTLYVHGLACFFLFSPHRTVSFIFPLFFPYFLL